MKRKALLLLIPFAVAGLAGCQSADPGNPPVDQCDQAEITLNKTEATLKVGESVELVATAPEACGELGWGVDQAGESVVSLEKNGTKCTVHALAAGTAIVGYGTTASCTITVEDGPVTPVHAGTLDDPFDNADAILVANSLEPGEATEDEYYIKGKVAGFEEDFSPSYGNYSFSIEGGFICWRLKNGPEYQKFEEGDIEIGDEVVVFAKIQKYHKDGQPDKPETKDGYVHSVKKDGPQEPSLKLDKTEASLKIGKTVTITATVKNTEEEVAWSIEGTAASMKVSDDKKSVTLTGVSVGSATVKAKLAIADLEESCVVAVSEPAPAGQGAVYTFVNDKTSAQNWSTIGEDGFKKATVGEGDEIIIGYKDGENAYIGGNGGSGDTAWNIWNCLKVGKSGSQGKITIKLDSDLSFECIKISAIGSRDDGTLVVNGISKDVTKKATKDDLEPMVLEYDIGGGISELTLTSKPNPGSKENFGICITRIEFVGRQETVLESISADITNKEYEVGDPLSLEGLEVIGHYSDGNDAPITEGIITSLEAGHIMTLEDTSLRVSVGEIYTDIALTVTDPTLVLDYITIAGVKTQYYAGQTLGDVTVTAHYIGGTELDVTSSAVLKIGDNVVSSDHIMAVGESKIVATYMDETDEVEFTVVEEVIEVDKAVELTSAIITHEKPTDYGTNENGDYAYVNLLKNTQGTPESIQGSGTTSDSRPDRSILYNSKAFSKPIVGIKLEIGTKNAGATATANLTFGTSVKAAGSNKVTLSGSSGTADYKTLDVASSSIEFKLTATDCKYFALNYTSGAVYFSKITLIFDESYVPAQPSVKSVTVTPETLDLMVGAESTLTAQVEVENGASTAVEWKSNNEDVALVENGKVTAVGEGEATITATSVFDDTKYDECVVTVSAAQASKFEKVNSTSELVVGQEVVLAAATKNLAISKERQTNNIKATDISRVDNKLAVLSESVEVFTLEAGTVDGTFAFKAKSDGKYICATSSSSNYLKTEETKSANSSFAISFDSGVATTTAQGSFSRNELHCNFGNNPPIFSCYAAGSTTGEKLSIYQVPYNEPTEGLKSITVSGPTKVEYELNEAFDPDGLVVTASYYGDVKDADVTALATYDAPDMTTEGRKEVVVSYTEGGETKTASFFIQVGEVIAEKGTLENPYTGAEAYAIAEAMTQLKTAAPCGSVYIKGVVQKFNQTFDTKYGNYSFTIDGGFICWQLKNGESQTSFVGGELSIGDEVIVKAEIQKFSDNQMETMGGYIHSITRGTSTIEVDSSSSTDAVVDLHDVTSAVNGSTFTFDVSVDADHEIVSVKVNGSDATVVTEGTYSFVVDGPAKIIVETKNAGEKSPEVYKSIAFTQANCKQTTNSYTGTAKFASDSINYECANFNTNNTTWNLIKCGRNKGNASVASIANTNAIDEEIVSITITFNACTVEKLNEAYLLISDSNSFDGATKVSFDVVSNQAVTIKIPAEAIIDDGFYKIVFDCAAGDANGFIAVESVDFNYIPA